MFCRLIHSQKPWYQVSVRQARYLPTASFGFHLAMDTLAFGCSLPTVRAAWGLAPVRTRSCWANKKVGTTTVCPPNYNDRFGLILQHLGCNRLELWHCTTNWSTNICWVADNIFLTTNSHKVALYIIIKAYSCCDVIRIVEQHNIEA